VSWNDVTNPGPLYAKSVLASEPVGDPHGYIALQLTVPTASQFVYVWDCGFTASTGPNPVYYYSETYTGGSLQYTEVTATDYMYVDFVNTTIRPSGWYCVIGELHPIVVGGDPVTALLVRAERIADTSETLETVLATLDTMLVAAGVAEVSQIIKLTVARWDTPGFDSVTDVRRFGTIGSDDLSVDRRYDPGGTATLDQWTVDHDTVVSKTLTVQNSETADPAADIAGNMEVNGDISATGTISAPVVNATTNVKEKGEILLPPGVVLPYVAAAAPGGFLLCDGTSYLRSAYPDLFAVIQTSHGAADGTHFNVPDYRGRFLRGWSNGSGRDPEAGDRAAMTPGGASKDAVGSVQDEAFKSHSHSLAFGSKGLDDGGNPSLIVGGGYSTLAAGGAETRPVNAYVNYIIKT
jgi:hypothetical protein